jgi:hypothetical protein
MEEMPSAAAQILLLPSDKIERDKIKSRINKCDSSRICEGVDLRI